MENSISVLTVGYNDKKCFFFIDNKMAFFGSYLRTRGYMQRGNISDNNDSNGGTSVVSDIATKLSNFKVGQTYFEIDYRNNIIFTLQKKVNLRP